MKLVEKQVIKLINGAIHKRKTYFDGDLLVHKEDLEKAGILPLGEGYTLMAVYLCLHMAAHLIYRGFGIRQICDLVLLIDKRGDLINWDSFIEKIRLCNIETFTKTIFLICNKLFSVN